MEEEQQVEEEIPPGGLETNADVIIYSSEPSKMKGSKYHKYLFKELAIGKLEKDDVEVLQSKFRLIELFTYLDIPELARMYAFEVAVKANLNRSVGGFERIQHTSYTHNVNRKVADQNPQKGILGGR